MSSATGRRTFIGWLGASVGVGAATGVRPALSAPTVDASKLGAVADGRTPATAALQKAIDVCAAAGGGTVLVPAGRYLSGALTLRSHVNFQLAAGAVLVASERMEDFPPVKGRHDGIERMVHAPLLGGTDLQNVAITGRGQIDGRGSTWWEADEATRKIRVDAKMPREAENPASAPLRWPRPRVINLVRCKDVLVEGLTIKDGAGYNLQLIYCEDVVVDSLTASQQRHVEGTDCIVIDSSKRVSITGCTLSSGGDCIGIKSGYNEDGRRVNIPSEDIVITGCHMRHNAGSSLGIGSETAGSIRNVLFANCVVEDSYRGMHFRSPRGRGGVVEKVRVDNVVFDGIEELVFKISHFYDSVRMEGRSVTPTGPGRTNLEIARSRIAPVDAGTPTFRDFTLSNLTLGRVGDIALVEGLPERHIHRLTIQNVTVAQGRGGMAFSMSSDVSISNISVENLETPVVDARDSQRLEIHRIKCSRPRADVPAVWLDNVASAFVHGCDIPAAAPTYAWYRQEESRDVGFGANNVPPLPGATPPPPAAAPPPPAAGKKG
jgi:polygalacturonase